VLADGRYPDLRPLRNGDELHEFFTAFRGGHRLLKSRDVAALKEIEQALEKARRATRTRR